MLVWDRVEDLLFWLATSICAGITTAAVWFVRVVFTNQKQIEMMRAEFTHRDQLRAEDREDISEIKASVIKIQDHLMKDTKHE